jgi:M6 family metalloprotease-like protein
MLTRLLFGALALAGLSATLPAQDCAFPVHPGVLEQLQPDGSRVRLRFMGQAFAHWYQDENGYPVVATSGGYMYAKADAAGAWSSTGIPVGSLDPGSLGLTPDQAPTAPGGLARPPRWNAPGGHEHAAAPSPSGGALQPEALPESLPASSTGTVKNLVIGLRFSNHGPAGQNRTLPSASDVDKIMNAVGGDPVLAPTGSVRDHYLQNSYGLLTINSTVLVWVDVPNTESYYANGNSGLTTRTFDLIAAALSAADPSVDFASFDADNDGWIDAITFLHSGYGAEWGGNDQYGTNFINRMWSHKWEIPAWTSAEGVKVSDYNISPGLWGTSGSQPGRIGVVCHELGHFFGLPDLYDTNGSGQGIGNWCLMASGSWGFDGSQRYPSHMSAWCKAKLGWVKPERILPGTYTALQVELNPIVYRIDTGYPVGEYLLIENRQKIGFDAQLPQGGLAIWHVDDAQHRRRFPGPGGLAAEQPPLPRGIAAGGRRLRPRAQSRPRRLRRSLPLRQRRPDRRQHHAQSQGLPGRHARHQRQPHRFDLRIRRQHVVPVRERYGSSHHDRSQPVRAPRQPLRSRLHRHGRQRLASLVRARAARRLHCGNAAARRLRARRHADELERRRRRLVLRPALPLSLLRSDLRAHRRLLQRLHRLPGRRCRG